MPFFNIGPKRAHYTDFKPETCEVRATFIFMHGLGSSQNYYLPMIPEFTKNSFRCIVFDNTGAGRSSYTYIEQSVDSLAQDVVSILDALNIPKAIMVGHSMGGIVAAHLASTQSDRIIASVWIGPVYPSADVAQVFEKRIETVEKQGMEAMANTIPQVAVGAKANSLVRAMIRELLLGQDSHGYISNCRVIAGAQPPDYASIDIPILVIAGAEDKSAPLAGVEKMVAEVGTKEKKLIVLDGVGHWHCLEAPEAVTKHIFDFYNECR